MSSYTNIFTGSLIQTSNNSLNQFDLTGTYNFIWPTEFVDLSGGTIKVLTQTVLINPTNGVSKILLPNAKLASTGYQTIITNISGGFTFDILKFDGVSIVENDLPAGSTILITLTDNSTTNGEYNVVSIFQGNTFPVGTFGNISITANTISSTNANGPINLLPNGTGDIALRGVTVDSADAMSGLTALTVDNISLNGNTLSITNINGGFTVTPNGTGTITLRSVTIDNLNNIANANSLIAGNIATGIVDSNTISSTNVNGAIILAPNGTGEIETYSVSQKNVSLKTGSILKFWNAGNANYSGLTAPVTPTNSTWSIPATEATTPGSAMTTSGTGILSFSTIPGHNLLINPEAQVAQRGAGGTATFSVNSNFIYGLDRWQFGATAASGTIAHCNQFASLPSGNFEFQVGRDTGNAGTGTISFAQSVLRTNCNEINGNKVTLSFKASAGTTFSSAGGQITVSIITGTGINDPGILTTPFTGQVTASTTINLTNSLEYYTITSAAVIAANVTQIAVKFSYIPVGTAGVDDNFYITQIQLERGSSASPYASQGFDLDYRRCLPYYQKSFSYTTLPAQASADTSAPYSFIATAVGALANRVPTIPFVAPMRATPSTITTYNPVSANAFPRDVTGGVDFSAIAVNAGNEKGFIITSTTGNAATAVGDFCTIHYTADAEMY